VTGKLGKMAVSKRDVDSPVASGNNKSNIVQSQANSIQRFFHDLTGQTAMLGSRMPDGGGYDTIFFTGDDYLGHS
jgi:hypothetical protein